MLAFSAPAFLVAGALAALVPLALHLIARRPPVRAALPTLRFLARDPRVALRLQRPTDLPLLALRMLWILLLGAGLAGPSWTPAREGTADLVLLDRSAGMEGAAWSMAVEEARRALLGPEGEPRGSLVLFDTAAVRVPPGAVTAVWLDSLASAGPGGAPADYAAALRALPLAARELRGADSVRAILLSTLRWEGWRPGLPHLRRAAWPGALRLPVLPGDAGPDPSSPSERVARAVVLAPEGEGGYATAALAATGWKVSAGGELPDSAAAYLVLSPVAPEVVGRLLDAARGGATVVVASGQPAAPLRDALPWRWNGEDGGEAPGALAFGPELRLAGAAEHAGGRPSPGARWLAVWEDGRPAAAAAPLGEGCLVYLAAPLEGGSLPLSAAFPRAVDRLARACEDADGGVPAGMRAAPLDAGARALLRGDGAEEVPAREVEGGGGGLPLGRWVLLGALAVALAETALAYGRRKG